MSIDFMPQRQRPAVMLIVFQRKNRVDPLQGFDVISLFCQLFCFRYGSEILILFPDLFQDRMYFAEFHVRKHGEIRRRDLINLVAVLCFLCP